MHYGPLNRPRPRVSRATTDGIVRRCIATVAARVYCTHCIAQAAHVALAGALFKQNSTVWLPERPIDPRKRDERNATNARVVSAFERERDACGRSRTGR